jgi:hypothetical protein
MKGIGFNISKLNGKMYFFRTEKEFDLVNYIWPFRFCLTINTLTPWQ